MSAFDWGDCYLTGEDEIDVQHRRLVELINTFADLVTGERTGGGIGVADALTALADYANVHFADEERLAEAAGTWQGSTSVGVASAAGVEADRAPALMRAADEALYAAKRGGRNCVATSTGVVAPRRRRGPGSHAGYCHSH